MIFPPSFQLPAALRFPKEKSVFLYLTALPGALHFPMNFSNWAFNLIMPKVGKSSFYHFPLLRGSFASSFEVYNVSLFPEQLFFPSPHLAAHQGNTKGRSWLKSLLYKPLSTLIISWSSERLLNCKSTHMLHWGSMFKHNTYDNIRSAASGHTKRPSPAAVSPSLWSITDV